MQSRVKYSALHFVNTVWYRTSGESIMRKQFRNSALCGGEHVVTVYEVDDNILDKDEL